jgi:cell wall-associated NlpC family hydrolase
LSYFVQGAVLAPTTTVADSAGHMRRVLVLFAAIALAITLIATMVPQATDARTPAPRHPGGNQGARIVAIARSHLGARFRIGTTGMRYFDCSGLVYRVYAQAHLVNKIGGTRMRAASYYSWFRRHHAVSRSNPKPGDVIWWTKHGRIAHMGLYIGNGRALSALTTGVKKHSLRGISVRFLAYGHVNLSR